MTDKTDSALEDIAFMRSLAEAGRRRDKMGGQLLIVSGLMFGGASLFHWATLTGRIHLGWMAVNVVWISVSLIFAALLAIFWRGQDTAARAGRQGMSIAIYVLLFVFAFATWKLRSAVVMELFMATVFALYGANWLVAAQFSGRTGLRWVAVASFASAIVMALLLNNPNNYLFFAVALMAVSVAPGLMLRRLARAES